ncbi:MAG: FAD-dependent thymidylate synthase [Selenomonas sp.]|nr:FAD-dependent thymidylate synthase [Selenomonas sp.]
MIKVKLLEYTPEPERVVAMAARLCYSATGAEELSERLSEEQVKKMVKKMVALGHASTIEHVSFTFGIEGVSRVLTHQLVRHRIASYDQQSQRYVAAHGFQYITPPTIEANPAANERFDKLLADIRSAYDDLVEMGIPKEDARYVLANAAETKILVTMNARTLLHFFNLRCCNRAQWEIRDMAYKMLAEVKKVAPTLFHNAGTSCVNTGRCPEGELACGKFAEMMKLRED